MVPEHSVLGFLDPVAFVGEQQKFRRYLLHLQGGEELEALATEGAACRASATSWAERTIGPWGHALVPDSSRDCHASSVDGAQESEKKPRRGPGQFGGTIRVGNGDQNQAPTVDGPRTRAAAAEAPGFRSNADRIK